MPDQSTSGQEKAAGKGQELKGMAKEAFGKVTDDDQTRAEGHDERFTGEAKQAHAEGGRDSLGNPTDIEGDGRR